MNLDMAHEPIRLPAWVASVLAVAVLPFAVDVLTGIDWQQAMAAALTAVIPLLAYTESKRARTDSPATVNARRAKVAASVATPTERRIAAEQPLGPEGGHSSYTTVWTVVGILAAIFLVILIAGAL